MRPNLSGTNESEGKSPEVEILRSKMPGPKRVQRRNRSKSEEDPRDRGSEVKKNEKFQNYGYAAFTQELTVSAPVAFYVCDRKNTIFDSSSLRCIVG